MMKRTMAGVLLATVAVYAWGMLYWGVNPLPYQTWKVPADEVAAGRAVKELFPARGTYYLPTMEHEGERLAQMYEHGPVAFVHVTSSEGRPQFEPSVLIKGFLLYLVVVALVAVLLRLAASALPRYRDRVKAVSLVGLAAALLINLGDVVYWYLPLGWQLHLALYNFTAFVVIGLVLGKLVQPAATD